MSLTFWEPLYVTWNYVARCRCVAGYQGSLEWALMMATAVPSMMVSSLRPKHSVLNFQRVPDLTVKVTLATRGSPTCIHHAVRGCIDGLATR